MHLWCNSDSIAQLNAKIIGKPVAEHLGLTPILSERRDRDPANQLKVSLFLHQGGKDAMCTGGEGNAAPGYVHQKQGQCAPETGPHWRMEEGKCWCTITCTIDIRAKDTSGRLAMLHLVTILKWVQGFFECRKIKLVRVCLSFQMR